MNPGEPQSRTPVVRYVVLALLAGIAFGWLAAGGCVPGRSTLNPYLLNQASFLIHREYVDQNALQSRRLTYGAIDGMVNALGDTGHSTFLTPEMVARLKQVEHGEFKGIGAELQMKDGHVVVVAPLDNSPAKLAGIRPGDIILKVNGNEVAGLPLSQVVDRITGPAGTRVQLTVLGPHSEKTRELMVTRAAIKLHEVVWQRLPDTEIVHLRIGSFDAGVSEDLRKALVTIQHEGAKALILDLRDNPGGLLEEAIGAASQFLRSGNVVLVKDANGQMASVPVDKGGVAFTVPLVVLIDYGTASGAEIVAGALRDAHRATLVGETTFGTGTVLQQFGLYDGSALLLAVEEWLTPDGHSFWHKGVAPQVTVPLPPETMPVFPEMERSMTPRELQSSGDAQLLRALALAQTAAGAGGLNPASSQEK